MSKINSIINKRHTTRLMSGSVSENDVATILDSARRAPSKNKIYGYKIFALGETDQAKEFKKELCDKITLYKDNEETIYLMQTLAPLVLVYMANPAPEHQMLSIDEQAGTEIFDRSYSEVAGKADRYAMIKSSVRDAMISASYAQLTAEELGYGTAFVACGLEDLMSNKKFQDLIKEELDGEYIEPVVIVCIGPKDQKIKDIFAGDDDNVEEPYKDGVTHYRRSGREESFFVNSKQRSMIIEI